MSSGDPIGNATTEVAEAGAETDILSEKPIERKSWKTKGHDRIKYRVEYLSPTNSVIHQYETPGPHFEDESTASSQSTVFEIVTTFRTANTTIQTDGGAAVLANATAPVRTMRILSKTIMHALRSIVQYYPSQDLTSDVVTVHAPYPVLVHHYDELMEYRERFKPGTTEELCYREKDAYEDIGVLKEFLDENIMPQVEEEKARNRRGFTKFDMQWVALKPGTPYKGLRGDNSHYAAVVHSFTGGSFSTPPGPWILQFWNFAYDGEVIGRRLASAVLEKFDGEEPTGIAPIDLNDMESDNDLQKIIAEGELYWNLLKKQCKYYKGRTLSFPHNEVEGLVMVDMEAYYAENPRLIPPLLSSNADSRTWVSDCACSVCSERRDAQAAEELAKQKTENESLQERKLKLNEPIFPKLHDYLEDYQYLFLPAHIFAYVFRTRTWEYLHVKGFSDPKFEEDMIENLVMDKGRVQTLKALAKSFIRINQYGEKSERKPWSADFVGGGKGTGLIFLLHGKPGVGKTCTAECIAAFTSRPLMVLTSSDIGTSPLKVEANLTKQFKTARSWGAVLLIDEADVFMERRSTADLNRNSLVAGFLRALEFYDGILFLTTNRVGAFDDAFVLRIHVQLYYPDFDDESRQKVWQTFINKLQKERGDYMRLNIDAKEYLRGNELKAVKWNGREIRNAFQTAVALAEYEAIKDEEGKIILNDKHLRAVVEMSRDFKEYLNELHRGDEGKRAERRQERLNM